MKPHEDDEDVNDESTVMREVPDEIRASRDALPRDASTRRQVRAEDLRSESEQEPDESTVMRQVPDELLERGSDNEGAEPDESTVMREVPSEILAAAEPPEQALAALSRDFPSPALRGGSAPAASEIVPTGSPLARISMVDDDEADEGGEVSAPLSLPGLASAAPQQPPRGLSTNHLVVALAVLLGVAGLAFVAWALLLPGLR